MRLSQFILPTLPRGGTDADVVICVESEGEGYRLVRSLRVESAPDFEALVVAAVRAVDDAVVARLRSLAAVHAGVVTVGGKALLLPGKTHAGKSTLVAELVRRGATYFSDEYALIDGDGNAHPYPRPLLLRKSGEEQQVASIPDRFGSEKASVGWVMVLQFNEASPWRLEPVPKSEALLTLLTNTPHILAEEPRILEPLGRAAGGAQCYAGCRGEAAEAAERILELCTG